jgi:hypothetical protein
MEKTKVVVTGSTGSAYKSGELLPSGIIKYNDGAISHISAEISQGKSITEYVEPAPVIEPVIEKPSIERSQPVKNKKKKS